MKPIYFAYKAVHINKISQIHNGENIHYAVFNDVVNRDAVLCARSTPGFNEINLTDFRRETEESGFLRSYVDFMAELNNANDSYDWWIFNFTGKSALSAKLCEWMYALCIISKLLKNSDSYDVLVIITDQEAVAKQIRCNYKEIFKINILFGMKLSEIFKEILPIAIIYNYLKTIIRKLFVTAILGNSGKNTDIRNIIKTIVLKDSFVSDSKYRDVYFGQFIEYLKDKNIPFAISALIYNEFKQNVFKIKNELSNGLTIIPNEQSISFAGIAAAALKALFCFYLRRGFAGSTVFMGSDVRILIGHAIKSEAKSNQYNFNLFCAESIKGLLRNNHKIDRYIYPFENRGWEKAEILTVRRLSPGTKIVGYQHAAITMKHTEYMIGKNENVPLPDKIISMGEITGKMLVKYGNFNNDRIINGPALRQSHIMCENNVNLNIRKNIKNILILLSTSHYYYARTLCFLNGISDFLKDYDIRLRTHSVIPLDIKTTKDVKYIFEFINDQTLENAINWSDVVFYSSSTTAALFALALSKPAVYLYVDEYLDPDPLFEINDIKWTARKPEEIIDILKSIQNEEEYKTTATSEKSKAYIKGFIGKNNDENMSRFLT